MKKILYILFTFILMLAAAGCGKKITIAIPGDVTNQARALMLLADCDVITLKEGIDISASLDDIVKKPRGVEFVISEAEKITDIMEDVDFALINSNFAIEAGVNPAEDALAIEDYSAVYGNIVAVRAGDENRPEIKALIAALESRMVADFVRNAYDGAVISHVKNPGDGFDAEIDYSILEGTTLRVAATPAPHAEMLGIAGDILATKGITLEIVKYSEYNKLNDILVEGEVDANFFQHILYMKNYNEIKDANLVSAGSIHIEPMGIYGGKMKNLSKIK